MTENLRTTNFLAGLRRPVAGFEPKGFPLGERALLIILFGIFLALNFFEPALPGMTWEGLLKHQFIAAQILDLFKTSSPWKIVIEGRLPSSLEGYHSIMMAYLFAPFLAIFGKNWMLIKYWAFLFDIGAVVFGYLFVRNLFGSRTALVCLLLLVINPTYELGVRVGGSQTSYLHFFSMGTLYFLSRWWLRKKNVNLFAAMLILGVALCTNVWVFWLPPALAASLLIFRKELAADFGWRSLRDALPALGAGLLGLALGSSLIIYRQVFATASPFESLLGQFLSPGITPGLLSRLDVAWRNMSIVHNFISGDHFFDRIFANAAGFAVDPTGDRLFPWAVYASVLFLLFGPARRLFGKRVLIPCLIFTIMLCELILTPHKTPHLHIFFLYPFPPILVGIAVTALFETAGRRRWARGSASALMALLLFGQLSFLGRCFVQLRATGGERLYSEAIGELADWVRLNHRRDEPLFSFADGDEIERHLFFMMPELELRYVYIGGETPVETGHALAAQVSMRERPITLIQWKVGGTAFSRLDPAELARDHGLTAVQTEQFRDSDGMPVFSTFRIFPSGKQPA